MPICCTVNRCKRMSHVGNHQHLSCRPHQRQVVSSWFQSMHEVCAVCTTVHAHTQFITQAERLLLEQPDAFSDTQVWDFVAELRALGMPLGSSHARAAAAAAEAARQAADTPSAAHKKAEETAAAEAAWQQQLQAVGERLARHFAALGPEQRAVALAAASDCSDVQNPSQT